MAYKYGEFPKEQIQQVKKRLQNSIFKLLYMKEDDYEELDSYFASLLWKLEGYNELFGYQETIIELLAILERARIEAKKENYSHHFYRKAILDATSLVDKIQEDGDVNA